MVLDAWKESMANIDRHNEEIAKNLKHLQNKPILKRIYRQFHEIIANHLPHLPGCQVVEIGSGATDITRVIPNCIRTDIFQNPWIDSVENVYDLSFADASLSAVILIDVFHHLQYPGTALRELHRVLSPTGRVIMLEPCVSLLGLLIYGMLHDEPLALRQPIRWEAPESWLPANIDYYAAQGNATRIFMRGEVPISGLGWNIHTTRCFSAISYVASGGYSGPQMYPDCAYFLMTYIDKICNFIPSVFATRLMIVLEKNGEV